MTTQNIAVHNENTLADVFLVSLLVIVLTIGFGLLVFFGVVFAFKALFPSLTMTNSYYAAIGSVFFLACVVVRNSIKKQF